MRCEPHSYCPSKSSALCAPLACWASRQTSSLDAACEEGAELTHSPPPPGTAAPRAWPRCWVRTASSKPYLQKPRLQHQVPREEHKNRQTSPSCNFTHPSAPCFPDGSGTATTSAVLGHRHPFSPSFSAEHLQPPTPDLYLHTQTPGCPELYLSQAASHSLPQISPDR